MPSADDRDRSEIGRPRRAVCASAAVPFRLRRLRAPGPRAGLTGWRLFSELRTDHQVTWRATVVAGEEEAQIAFAELPRAYRNFPARDADVRRAASRRADRGVPGLARRRVGRPQATEVGSIASTGTCRTGMARRPPPTSTLLLACDREEAPMRRVERFLFRPRAPRLAAVRIGLCASSPAASPPARTPSWRTSRGSSTGPSPSWSSCRRCHRDPRWSRYRRPRSLAGPGCGRPAHAAEPPGCMGVRDRSQRDGHEHRQGRSQRPGAPALPRPAPGRPGGGRLVARRQGELGGHQACPRASTAGSANGGHRRRRAASSRVAKLVHSGPAWVTSDNLRWALRLRGLELAIFIADRPGSPTRSQPARSSSSSAFRWCFVPRAAWLFVPARCSSTQASGSPWASTTRPRPAWRSWCSRTGLWSSAPPQLEIGARCVGPG